VPYGVIYKITNLVNGKLYIGQTTQPLKKRWRQHISCNYCQRLFKAVVKYGPNNFKIEEIDSASNLKELNIKEESWISSLNTTNSLIGYNLLPGGKNKKHHESTKRKMRVSQKNRPPKSLETRLKISESHKGKKLSDYIKKKISDSNKNRWNGDKNAMFGLKGENHPAFGSKRSDEVKKKLSEDKLGDKNPQFGKKRSKETLEKQSKALTGKRHSIERKKNASLSNTQRKVIYCHQTKLIYHSISEAGRQLKISTGAICRTIKGENGRTHVHGYTFEYLT